MKLVRSFIPVDSGFGHKRIKGRWVAGSMHWVTMGFTKPLILLGLVAIAQSVFVREGDPIILKSSLPPEPQKANPILDGYTWKRIIETGKAVPIRVTLGNGGNCFVNHAHFQGRMKACGRELRIEDATVDDSGVYEVTHNVLVRTPEFKWWGLKFHEDGSASQPGNRKRGVELFYVSVFRTKPVLTLPLINSDSVHIRCDDLWNEESELFLELEPTGNTIRPKTQGLGRNLWRIEAMRGDNWKMMVDSRCCVASNGHITCTPWAKITLSQVANTRLLENRAQVCRHRGENNLAEVSFTYSQTGALPSPTCFNHYFVVEEGKVLRLCQGEESYLVGPKGAWHKQRPLGSGLMHLTDGTSWQLDYTSLADSGQYVIKHDTSETKYTIEVIPRLRAAVRLINLKEDRLELECVHTGSRYTEIMWTVEGQYSTFETSEDGTSITIYPNCAQGADRSTWYYKFGVRCLAMNGPFDGWARWVLGEASKMANNTNKTVN
ncbi:hypothetical protein RHVP.R5 [Cricetid gammaherpesvirus 2]|uniref:Uncharacterized protein n=1 Tax=Cricetid gammaherpesvirus 2 TaxID=1605972 RepID=E9M5I4_9GAMA|nr:hypothetical protein RHVP.R5 [Cricetid gammaherpesvirus 2]ADW24342.1 hypothetical protein RHVP.R5 [Cricetid gammaherpesvirus 2]ADW24424.1 hypothetical protein RHVP-L.R5 [Cricetid gammaherpesvirus 2]